MQKTVQRRISTLIIKQHGYCSDSQIRNPKMGKTRLHKEKNRLHNFLQIWPLWWAGGRTNIIATFMSVCHSSFDFAKKLSSKTQTTPSGNMTSCTQVSWLRCKCCIFRPAFDCCMLPKADPKTFLAFSDIFSRFQLYSHHKSQKSWLKKSVFSPWESPPWGHLYLPTWLLFLIM